ncbi:RNA polymerase sigma factor, sigma-70 family [Oligella urethralis]|uniref:RNA polymerase sigma factor, sigma-70 family n=3 Tax=Oligella urethralis TaxID=90245 RepID=A0A2X1VIE0_9BURK|nr:RNA polymerase sigma factor, sigma-70 family [Oligella urethralis]
MSYINARLEQWAEYVTKQNLVAIGSRRLRCGGMKLYRQEVEAERLTWVKRTHRAVLSLEPELRDVVQLRYLFAWKLQAICEYYGVVESTVSRRLEKARYLIADYFEEERAEV